MPKLADEVDELLNTAMRAARKIDTMCLRGETERRSELDCLIEAFKDFSHAKRRAVYEALSKGDRIVPIDLPFGDPADTPEPVPIACVHCGHVDLPHHQCAECCGIPDDPDMPWAKLDPNNTETDNA